MTSADIGPLEYTVTQEQSFGVPCPHLFNIQRGADPIRRTAVVAFNYEPEQLPVDLRRAFERVGWHDYIKSDTKVFVKPNFTLPFYKPGVTTSGSIIEAALGMLRDRASEVFIGESDGGYASFTAEASLKNHGIPGMCQRTGSTMLNLSKIERTRIRETINEKAVEVTLPRKLLEMDVSISIPVLKVHVVTGVSLALKNVWGCHPDTLRLLDHTHLPERLALIAKRIHLRYGIIDAIFGLDGRGPMDGHPVKVGAVLVGNNPVALDATATRMVGFRAEMIAHIVAASQAGLGPHKEEEIELIGDVQRFQQYFHINPTVMDRLGGLTFKSDVLTKLVFNSPLTRPIYSILGRDYRKKISKPGEEL